MGWRTRTAIVMMAAALAGCGTEATPSASDSALTPTPTASTPTAPSTPVPTQTATVTPKSTATSAACEKFGSTKDVTSSDPLAMSTLTGAAMRVGRHACFERFVFEMAGTGEDPGWSVGYADPMAAQGSGEPVELLGDADLEVVVQVWTVPDFEGRPDEWPPFSGPDDIVTSGFTALKEVRNFYAFEGVTQIGLGVDEKRPFRVKLLQDPPRLVVDVATG